MKDIPAPPPWVKDTETWNAYWMSILDSEAIEAENKELMADDPRVKTLDGHGVA